MTDDILENESGVLENEAVPEDVQEAETGEGDMLDGEASVEAGEGDIPLDGAGEVSYSLTFDYDALYDAVYDASLDAIEAYAQSVTDGQTINSTALSYFQGVLNNQILPVDYVIYVGSPYYYNSSMYYEYCMAYGDLELSGTHFTGTGTVITMRVSGYRSVNYAENQAVSLTAPMYYSRSNLGNYSGAVHYDWSGFLTLVSLGIGGLVWLIKKLLRTNY